MRKSWQIIKEYRVSLLLFLIHISNNILNKNLLYPPPPINVLYNFILTASCNQTINKKAIDITILSSNICRVKCYCLSYCWFWPYQWSTICLCFKIQSLCHYLSPFIWAVHQYSVDCSKAADDNTRAEALCATASEKKPERTCNGK